MRTSTFRVNSIGYRPLGLIFLGGDRGTSRGKRHNIEHIGLHGTQTFRVNSFRGGQGTEDWGPGKGYNIL
jgi:hypothetical protein